MEVDFNYNSMRAQKARLQAKVGLYLKIAAIAAIVLLVATGLWLLYCGNELSYFVLLAACWPLMVVLWQRGDLEKIEPAGKDIAGILECGVLGRLPKAPTPKDIVAAIDGSVGGKFFAARLGLPAGQLKDFVGATSEEGKIVFTEAMRIHQSLTDASKTLNGATLFAALIRVSPQIRAILPKLLLDEEDVVQGAEWFAHLNKIFEQGNDLKLTGGIARDWSFGYIPTLRRFGQNLSERYAYAKGSNNVRLESHQGVVDQMVQLFSEGGRQNATLIGAVGSGKTTVVEAFAERLMDGAKSPKNLQYRQVISLDATSLIAAAPGRGEVEHLVNVVLGEAYTAQNIILFLDNAHLFFEDATGSVDITNILQPVLENGAIKMILAMDEQKFLQINQRNAALAAAMNRIQIVPPNEAETMKIIEDNSLQIEAERKVVFMYQALREAHKLAERYVQDVAQPKRTIQVLEAGAAQAESGLVTADSIRVAMETTMGVKIGMTDNEQEKTKLLSLEDQIHERMINQVTAVKAVADSLRRARAGVRSENRPIGTFLFLGPTGVGKTELAKTLSEVYFGGEGNMVRLDMNEYVQPSDVQRLIADGAVDTNSLTAQIQKSPFSVVLLDEIEKAHANVLSTLLQVLDEGILRDINNREISFRDAIIIATSNAGANRIREYIDAGYQVDQMEEPFKNELIDSRQFTPEFLNRFDEITVFRPLSKEELFQVVGLQIKGVNKTLAAQKVSVNVADDAKWALVEAGYDPRLGARPMRRVVQKTVESIVANKLLSGELQSGQTLEISLADLQATGELEKNEK